MDKSHQDATSGDNRRVGVDRRAKPRRVTDSEPRLRALEELGEANRRELALQFHRIAQMQVDIDRLQRRALDGALKVEDLTPRETRRETAPAPVSPSDRN